MRFLLAILALVSTIGCQSEPRPAAREPLYHPGSAALVYTPPVAVDEADLDLSRAVRGPYAAGGVESTIIDTTYVYQDDRQRYDRWGDWSRFERRAVSTTVTVRQR